MRYVDMTDTIRLKIKICANPSYLCHLWFPINYHLILYIYLQLCLFVLINGNNASFCCIFHIFTQNAKIKGYETVFLFNRVYCNIHNKQL